LGLCERVSRLENELIGRDVTARPVRSGLGPSSPSTTSQPRVWSSRRPLRSTATGASGVRSTRTCGASTTVRPRGVSARLWIAPPLERFHEVVAAAEEAGHPIAGLCASPETKRIGSASPYSSLSSQQKAPSLLSSSEDEAAAALTSQVDQLVELSHDAPTS
jgi:hypothetical protein